MQLKIGNQIIVRYFETQLVRIILVPWNSLFPASLKMVQLNEMTLKVNWLNCFSLIQLAYIILESSHVLHVIFMFLFLITQLCTYPAKKSVTQPRKVFFRGKWVNWATAEIWWVRIGEFWRLGTQISRLIGLSSPSSWSVLPFFPNRIFFVAIRLSSSVFLVHLSCRAKEKHRMNLQALPNILWEN